MPSESRDEGRLVEHVAAVLDAGGVPVADLGDGCLSAGRGGPVLLAGHLDTVPAQGNLPGRRDAERVHGLGASDMKGALAVMIELALAGVPSTCCSSAARSCPPTESALAPLLEREPMAAELVVVMEPTDNELHAGCLGNVNATWTFEGRSGHSARPWDADNAIHAAARGVAALAAREPEEHVFDGLAVLRGGVGHADRGRDRRQRDPGPRRVPRQLPLRARPHARPRPRRGCASCARAASCGSTRWRRPDRSRSATRARGR